MWAKELRDSSNWGERAWGWLRLLIEVGKVNGGRWPKEGENVLEEEGESNVWEGWGGIRIFRGYEGIWELEDSCGGGSSWEIELCQALLLWPWRWIWGGGGKFGFFLDNDQNHERKKSKNCTPRVSNCRWIIISLCTQTLANVRWYFDSIRESIICGMPITLAILNIVFSF